MMKAMYYDPTEVRVKHKGKILSLEDWAIGYTQENKTSLLMYPDLECVIVIPDEKSAYVLDECGNWEPIDIEQLVLPRKEVEK